nr:helix-turn-helix transcriptional regulator [Ancylobacter lacus]
MGAYASADCARIVRSLRNAAGLTQAHLALALGVSQQRVSNIERGRTPNGTMLLTLLQVAEICGSTLRIEIVPPSGAAVTGATVHPLPVRSEGRAGAVKKSVVRK